MSRSSDGRWSIFRASRFVSWDTFSSGPRVREHLKVLETHSKVIASKVPTGKSIFLKVQSDEESLVKLVLDISCVLLSFKHQRVVSEDRRAQSSSVEILESGIPPSFWGFKAPRQGKRFVATEVRILLMR